ncbi:Protoheme IX farnesyltransferase, mitochondrial [Borealophlyctis nickersoniae]|nr:Protoheme IX farnesyltransferase, mitochondrial [Borealophlyctis nickersoniae]
MAKVWGSPFVNKERSMWTRLSQHTLNRTRGLQGAGGLLGCTCVRCLRTSPAVRHSALGPWRGEKGRAEGKLGLGLRERGSATVSGIKAAGEVPVLPEEKLRAVGIGAIPEGRDGTSVAVPADDTSSLRWKPSPAYTPTIYSSLSKVNLSALVTLTTMAGYAMAPGATDVATLLWTTVGTGMCISSANTINQWIEAPYDAQMSRTRNRVLVRHATSPHHGFFFGAGAGIAGVATLAAFVNPIVAILGGANILLYTCVYTPMKRTSIANTWAGAVVGAIPPMMGWAACTGSLDAGAWLMGTMLYAWQFPHFNSLSWNLRPDYSKAGYRMMSVVDPGLNGRVGLRYSLAMFPLCWAAPYVGLTTVGFAATSTIINGYMGMQAFSFWRNPNEKTARALFFGSIVHLPILLALMLLHKADKEEEEGEAVDD